MCSAFVILLLLFKKSPDADQSRKKKKEESLSIVVEYGQKESKMKLKWEGCECHRRGKCGPNPF